MAQLRIGATQLLLLGLAWFASLSLLYGWSVTRCGPAHSADTGLPVRPEFARGNLAAFGKHAVDAPPTAHAGPATPHPATPQPATPHPATPQPATPQPQHAAAAAAAAPGFRQELALVRHEALVRESQLVRSFEAGQVDWHDLVQEPVKSNNGEYDLGRLIEAEKAVTYYLTNTADVAAEWGFDHGPLGGFQTCDTVQDKCNVHERGVCVENSFCGWCEARKLCVSRDNGHLAYADAAACPGPLETKAEATCSAVVRVDRTKLVDASRSQCSVVVGERVFVPQISDDSRRMYFGWFRRFFEGFLNDLDRRGALADKANHIVVTGLKDQFRNFFHLTSKFCPREHHEVPEGTCFCKETDRGPSHPDAGRVQQFIVKELGLADVVPQKPRIGIVFRTQKRFILNQFELKRRIQDRLGVEVLLLPFELMTLYEATRELRQLTVFVAMHGSGCVNYMFLPKGSVAIQVLPYHVVSKDVDHFREFANRAGARYLEYKVESASNTVRHWHFADKKVQALRGDEAAFDSHFSQKDRDPVMFYTFWINQDSIIPGEAFEQWMRDALKGGIHDKLPAAAAA